MTVNEKQVIAFGIGSALIAILIIIAIIVIPIPINQFIEKIGLNTIEKINFSGNDMYYAVGGSLFNFDRPNYVLAGDQLWYSTLFQSKLDYSTELHAYFQVFVSGKNTTNLIKLEHIPKFTLEDKTNGAHWKYYAVQEGRNKIKTNFQFINSSNGVLLYSENKTIDFDVVSPAYALQDQSNNTTKWALIASVLVGVFTVVALISSTLYARSNVREIRNQNKTLVQQNEELKEQHSIQNRPWISVADVATRYSLKQNYLEINIKNFGKSPAHNILAKSFVSDETVSEEDVDIIPFGSDFYSLAPNEVISIRLIITPDEYKLGHGSGNPLYFGLKLKYTYENNKNGKFLLLGSINEGRGFAMTQIKKHLE